MIRVFAVVGTRPEAIKMAPVIHACQQRPDQLDLVLCSTGQQQRLLDESLAYFRLVPDVRLPLSASQPSLAGSLACFLKGLQDLLQRYEPDCVVAQGDTTTTIAAAMAAFYHRIPFVHVEAGLRTGCLAAPWPEEFNRRVVSLATSVHCAPTPRAAQHLKDEGVPDGSIHVVGNTIVDALHWTRRQRCDEIVPRGLASALRDNPMVLITSHRRENHGQPIHNLCRAVAILASRFPHVRFVYVLHSHPAARRPALQRLANLANVHLVEPLPYPAFVWLLDRSTIVVTDSGGIQEEAPSLGKPVVVVRNATERQEAIASGIARLAGTDVQAIVCEVTRLLCSSAADRGENEVSSDRLFGDGKAGQRIARLLCQRAWQATNHRGPVPPLEQADWLAPRPTSDALPAAVASNTSSNVR